MVKWLGTVGGGRHTMILREMAVLRHTVRVFRRFSCAGCDEI